MKQTPDDEGLAPKPLEGEPASGENDEAKRGQTLEERLELGAEPFWMQDIRLAARRIQEARAALRAAQSGDSAESE